MKFNKKRKEDTLLTIKKTLWNISGAIISIYIARVTPESTAKWLLVALIMYNAYKYKPYLIKYWKRVRII